MLSALKSCWWQNKGTLKGTYAGVPTARLSLKYWCVFSGRFGAGQQSGIDCFCSTEWLFSGHSRDVQVATVWWRCLFCLCRGGGQEAAEHRPEEHWDRAGCGDEKLDDPPGQPGVDGWEHEQLQLRGKVSCSHCCGHLTFLCSADRWKWGECCSSCWVRIFPTSLCHWWAAWRPSPKFLLVTKRAFHDS